MKNFKNLLAIESATSLCSVALRSGGVVCQLSTYAIGKHSSAIFTQAQVLLSSCGLKISDLDGILLGVGPGSYTGLRVAASAVKGMLFGQDVPLFGVNTLAGFAAGMCEFSGEQNVHVIIDARRTHVYTQSFIAGMSGIRDGQSSFAAPKSENKTIKEYKPESDVISKLNFTPYDHCLQSLDSLNDPSLTEIDEIYDRFHEGDFLIGTGLLRLNSSNLTKLHLREINKTSAIGLIQIFDAGLEQFYTRYDVTDFEPTYTVEEN